MVNTGRIRFAASLGVNSAYLTSDRTTMKATMGVGFAFPHAAAIEKVLLTWSDAPGLPGSAPSRFVYVPGRVAADHARIRHMNLNEVPPEAWVVLGSGITGLLAFSAPLISARVQRRSAQDQRDAHQRAAHDAAEQARLSVLRAAYVRVTEQSKVFAAQMENCIRERRAARSLSQANAVNDQADNALASLGIALTDAEFLSDDGVAVQLQILGQDANTFRRLSLDNDNVDKEYLPQLLAYQESEKKALAAMRTALRGRPART